MPETSSPADSLLDIGNRIARLVEQGERRYKALRAIAAVLAVVFSLILGLVIAFFVPQNSAVAGQSAQSLIGVDGFLAAASGVIAFFYSARLLEFASPSGSMMVAMRPIISAESDAAVRELGKNIGGLAQKFDLTRNLTPEEVAQVQKIFLDSLGAMTKRIFEKTGKLVRNLASPARRMAFYSAFVLLLLILSAFFSILAVLGGSVQYLATAFSFTALGSGFLALAWADAHVNLIRYLIAVQAHESMRSTFTTRQS